MRTSTIKGVLTGVKGGQPRELETSEFWKFPGPPPFPD